MTERDWNRVHALHREHQARVAVEVLCPQRIKRQQDRRVRRMKETSFNDGLFPGSFRSRKEEAS